MSKSTKRILQVFFALCVVIMIIDPFVPREHSHFQWENWPGFFGAYGFFSCVILVFIAKHGLRAAVMREEDSEE